MSDEHAALAKELAARPERQLEDPGEPETLDLALACARTGYDIGSLYLHALQARRRAARSGSAVALMRSSRAVNTTRQMILADAQ